MAKYVRVTPELSIGKQFDYAIPNHLESGIRLGHRLRVPWGQKTILAYAVDFPEQPEVPKCKDVLEIVGGEPLIPSVLCQLAKWMGDYYCCDFSIVLRGLLPEIVRSQADGYKRQLWMSVPEHLKEEEVLKVLGKAKKQKEAWTLAKKLGGGWLAECVGSTGIGYAVWRALEDKGLITLGHEKMERSPFEEKATSSQPHILNEEQKNALDKITGELDCEESSVFLLQGVTGSGKTEVYLQALKEVLDRGKSALVLVPEIALTPQTVEHFRRRFEGEKIRVAVLHSHLSQGERHDQWYQIREGRARVVIGARSAVFAPMQDLGIIIVDEEHENSYKQEETPHYHARDVAVMRGKLEKVPVVLGSATPSLESVYNARQGKYELLKLSGRIDGRKLPVTHVIDMRREVKKGKGRRMISETLKEAIDQRLEKEEQVILFLNRRGFATMVQCPNCGYVEECPNCAVGLTFHRSDGRLKCHMCGHEKSVPHECPECRFENYKYSGMGTQKIEEAVESEFPKAKWQRMDSDSMRKKNAYEQALRDFRDGRTDLLVGTQMIAKGLHFPNVTCVGVVNTDQALQLPDFRASERVFQQLVQVAGRAGRGDVAGEVFVQSYTPFHPSIQFARHHDVEGFQDQEMDYRKVHHYPPFSRVVLVLFRGKSEAKVKYCIEQAAKKIKASLPEKTEMDDPAPAPIERMKGEYRYHLFLKTNEVMKLSRVLRKEVIDVTWPEGIRASVDVDAYGML